VNHPYATYAIGKTACDEVLQLGTGLTGCQAVKVDVPLHAIVAAPKAPQRALCDVRAAKRQFLADLDSPGIGCFTISIVRRLDCSVAAGHRPARRFRMQFAARIVFQRAYVANCLAE
jgi:hypothetical protein